MICKNSDGRSGSTKWRTAMGFIAVLAMISAADLANAATYYVATNGNDGSGTGSSSNPWATISHAIQSVPDASLILVRPGTYNGVVDLRGIFATGVVVRSEVPYLARLRHTATVVRCFYGQGITLEGFDVAHAGPGAGALVIQVQDLLGPPGGTEIVSRITLRNNVLHDSYDNDILKINNGCGNVLVEGNLFYNQAGSDEHIDVNSVRDVVIQDNVFMNDFTGSGRTDTETSSFVVIKDSNGSSDGVLGAERVTVRRNVFLHWEGSSGQGYIRAGEDATANFEAKDVLVENNLLLGNNTQQIRSPFQCMGVQNVVIRANTVAGNLPAKEFGCRIFTVPPNPTNDGIHLHNNIWSDPTGTMGDTFNRGDNTTNLTFDNNLFWNAGNSFPTSPESIIEVVDDLNRVVGNPLLGAQAGLVLPRWNETAGSFADGSATIREVFTSLVASYGTPASGSPAIDAANAVWAPPEDILGHPRSAASADIGAVEATTGVAAPETPLAGAAGVQLLGSRPNPFRKTTAVRFQVGRPGLVTVRIVDVSGRLVRVLAAQNYDSGRHELPWSGADSLGREVPAGVYFCVIDAGGSSTSGRIVRLR